MPDGPAYVILGRGRWAGRMHSILSGEGRPTASIGETRRAVTESEAEYRTRLESAMLASGAQIAWLCLPPGPHMPPIVESAIRAGLDVICEKPWLCPVTETKRLIELARARHRTLGIHYEYCFLDEVAAWKKEFHGSAGLRFGGRFCHNRTDHLGISALDNLGSHLLSIREYAVPQAELGEIECGYNLPDERRVWVEKEGRRTGSIDLLASRQPIIQRFMSSFEAALSTGSFPLNLDFALQVACAIASLKSRAAASLQQSR